jgi:hypothetical protein
MKLQEYQSNFNLASILIASKRIIEKRAGIGILNCTYTAKDLHQAMGRCHIDGTISQRILESSTLGIGYSLHNLKSTPYTDYLISARAGKTHAQAKMIEELKPKLIIWDETRIKL